MDSRTIRFSIPFRRTPLDLILERSADLLAHHLARHPPRWELARLQMERCGIDPDPWLLPWFRSASRELLRILGRRHVRLDLNNLPAFSEQGAALFLSFHHGNWEWLMMLLSRMHPRACGIGRKAHHPIGQFLLEHHRRGMGASMLYDHEGLRPGRRHLQEGGLLAFLGDQRPPGASRPGQWMHHPTRVSPLPEWWSRKLTLSCWTGWLLPERFEYQLCIKPLCLPTEAPWDLQLDTHFHPLLTQRPDLYFGWTHHRIVSRETISVTPPTSR